jgi:hypothetical protein
MAKTYTANVKLPKLGLQKMTVQADSQIKAKTMLEAQYGKGSVLEIKG